MNLEKLLNKIKRTSQPTQLEFDFITNQKERFRRIDNYRKICNIPFYLVGSCTAALFMLGGAANQNSVEKVSCVMAVMGIGTLVSLLTINIDNHFEKLKEKYLEETAFVNY